LYWSEGKEEEKKGRITNLLNEPELFEPRTRKSGLSFVAISQISCR